MIALNDDDDDSITKNYKSCFWTIEGSFQQHSLKTDLCFEALAYLSLKADFKPLILSKITLLTQ